MGYQDRSYYRDSGRQPGNPMMWLLTGSVPLFTALGIRVRAHAMLLLAIIFILLFGLGIGGTQDRLIGAGALFTIVLLHEFGHCFAARYMDGESDVSLQITVTGQRAQSTDEVSRLFGDFEWAPTKLIWRCCDFIERCGAQ